VSHSLGLAFKHRLGFVFVGFESLDVLGCLVKTPAHDHCHFKLHAVHVQLVYHIVLVAVVIQQDQHLVAVSPLPIQVLEPLPDVKGIGNVVLQTQK